jgi:hypothetical protein
MKKKELIELANFYGFDFEEDLETYSERKGKTYALRDRRTGLVACVYATQKQIENYLIKKSWRT